VGPELIVIRSVLDIAYTKLTPLEIMPRCSLRARLRPGRAHAPEGGHLGRRLQRG
jgi:hypothetical protein